MLKMPFAMAAMINEDSTRGFKKGKRIAEQHVIVEWTEQSKLSKATILASDRYIVDIEVRNAGSDSEAEQIAGQLNLAALAKLQPAAK
jgi:hypothetical protein